MKIAYLDCFSGIAGDMTLGAFIDAGVSPELIEDPLRELLPGMSLEVEQVRKAGISAMSVHVKAERTTILRTALNIRNLLERAPATDRARTIALAIFDRLADAEARVHGTEVAHLVLHELGEPDTIADVLGVGICLDALGIDEVHASPIATGIGMARGEHGLYPIPGPAVTELLKGAPLYTRGVPYELVTPTGAAIVAATATRFGDPPPFTLVATGYGAGDRDLEHPNVLRVLIGEIAERSTATPTSAAVEPLIILETTVDDLDAEAIGFVCEEARRLGAHDAYATPATMKKGRPGAVITILSPPDNETVLRDLLFTQTTTLGIRRRSEHRYVLAREIITVNVDGYDIRVKLARDAQGNLLHVSPEHDDCAAAARALGLPLATIRERAANAAR